MKWCVLIPARNESAAIGGVVASLVGQGVDVLVIDDGSTDQTAQAARAAGARVLSRSGAHGKGTALRDGFAWAVSRDYEAVVTMDADGQHAPADARRLVEAAASSDAGIIIGNRMRQPKRMPLVRRWTNGFMSAILSLMARQHVPDTQCGLRLIRTTLLRDCHLQSDHFEIESELVLEAARVGARIASIPIRSIYRLERSQINPLSDTYRFFRFLWHRALGR